MDLNKENESQEGITVAIRMRPLNKNEGEKQRVWKVLPKYNSITQTTNTGKPLSERVTGRTYFAFDRVFEENIDTNQVYDDVAKSIVSSVVNGLNGTIFAYGQTSSGKTYTMQGSGTIEDGASAAGGIVHMAARDIFSIIQSQPNRMFLVRASFLEIYNEEVRDLLSSSSNTLAIREDPRRGVFVQSQEEMVTDFSSLLRLLFQGEKSRQVASTNMNERSSRSHTIFRITIESRENEGNTEGGDSEDSGSSSDGAVRISTLNLVDLAGSESVRHTGATGDRQKEGGMINQSLLTLSRVIVALGQPNSMHINFRDSKLTRILQPSLSGNARMAVICCATPSELYLEETRSTLQFASRAKLVKTNAQVNEVLDDRSIIRRLQRELAEARGQTTGPGTEHLRALENKAANAGTEALEAKKKLDRLKKSILNAASLFGGTSAISRPDPGIENRSKPYQNLRSRKRRQSDGIIPLPSGSTPLKSSARVNESPKTAPRVNKQKTRHPQLSPFSELSILRQALSSRGELFRALKQTLEKKTTLLHQKEDAFKGLEFTHGGLVEENERMLTELSMVQNALEAVQGNLDATVGEYDCMLAEKESILAEAFQKVEAGTTKVTALEEANGKLSEQLQDLQQKFDLLQQERVRSAFELAQTADEKEMLQAEREHDKLIIAEMNQKIGVLTSQANEAEKKCNTSQETVFQLQEQLSIANDEKMASYTKVSEMENTLDEMTKDLEEERRAGDMIRQELESQLEAKILEVQNALTHSTELEEQLKTTECEISELQDILAQATIEKEAERAGYQYKVSELESQLACTDAEKDDYATRASALGEDLRISELCLAEAHSRIAELEKAFIDERERSHKTLAEAHEQLENLSAARSQAAEQAELLISEVQRLQNELAQLQTKHDEMQRSNEELRIGAEASIDELRKLAASASSEKDSALQRCAILEEQSNCMMRTLETSQLSAEDLHASLAELEQKHNVMEADFHASRTREEQLSEQCEALQLECTNLQQEVEDLHHQNVELESFLRDTQEEAKRQHRELGDANRANLAEKAILEAMVAAKEESLLTLHSNYTNLRTQVTSKEIEKADLVNRVGVLSNDLDMMRVACVALEATVKKLENNENSLAHEFASLKERHNALIKAHQLLTEENGKLLERLSLLTEEKTEIERFLAAAEEESSTLCEENATLEGKLSEQRETVAALELSSRNATKARDGLLVTLENLQASMHSMEMEIRELHEELDRRNAERVEMECRVMSLETEKMAALAENDSFHVNQHEQMQVLEDKIAENDEHLDQLSRENREFADKCDEYDRHVLHLQSEVEELRTTREVAISKERELADQVGGLIEDLEGTRCIISALESDNVALRHQIEEMDKSCKAQIQTFEAELSASKETNEKADRALQRCQTDLEGLRASRDQAVNSLRDREQERDKAVAAMEDLYQKHQELSRQLGTALCGEKRSALEKEIVDLRQSSLELKHLLASTTGSERRLREKLATAESEVLSKTRALEDTQYRLSLLEEELRQSELAYEQKLATDASGNISLQERQDLLGEIDSLKSILNHERDDRKATEDDLKRQMGEEQRLLIQEGEKIMSELRVKISDLERGLAESQREAYTSRQQLDELHDEKQSTDRACHELQRTMEEAKSSLTRKESQLSSLQEELSKAKSELYSLKENAVELKERAKSDGRNIEKLERENAMAASELALLKRQISAIEKVKGELETECDRLAAQMKISSKNAMPSTELASQVRHLEIALQKREDTIKQQESAIESIRRESTSSSHMAEEIERLMTKIAEKDQRIKKLQKFKLTKEFAEEHKQLKKDNARLREELQNLQSEMESKGSDSALRTEVSELRFDKDALETKLRKFAAHCQRLEDDKVGVMDALRSCNIKLKSYDEVNDAVVSLCDQLASLQENISVASRGSPGRTQELERENQALQMKLDRVAASEERLSDQVARFQKERDELLRKLKAVSDSSDSENATSSDVSRKLRYLEQENLQLMFDVKTTKKQLQAAREEVEVLRLNALDNSTLVFGTVDLQSIASSEGSKSSSNQGSALRSTVKKEPLSDKTNDFLNVSSGKLSNKLPYGTVQNGDKNHKATIHSSAPGLGEAAVQGDETGECNQS